MKSLGYYIEQGRNLGVMSMLMRFWTRVKNNLSIRIQSFWWGWLARQEMSDANLLSQTTGEWHTMEALLDHLANRPASSFLFPHESPQETLTLLNQHFPEYVTTVLTSADAICRNEISLLGQVFNYPNGIDWHKEPVTGWCWPLWHRSRIGQYLYSPKRPADLIIFWELNRHQFFITLGIAYWLTNDQRYVDAFISNIQGWLDTNPLQHGLNWYYPLEISMRLLAWTAAFQFFRNSPSFREETGKRFLKSLWQQADFLSSHLQTTRTKDDIPNNHIMAELSGLVLLGTAFPEFRASKKWREIDQDLLTKQALAQTHPDGVHKEQAIGYHRFVTELLLLVVARSRQGALPHSQEMENVLAQMLNYSLFSQTPTGTVPTWGDSDYGRALGLGQNKDFWDLRPILSAGAVLYKRSDLKFAAGRFDEEAFWLLGTEGLATWQKIDSRQPQQTSQAFPDGGVYILRDSWTTDASVAFFRCGPFGLGGAGRCAHAHCDLLSLVMWVNGEPLLVDSGTYTYHGPWRNYFRLTAAHNTVMVDGQEQSEPKTFFGWKSVPEAQVAHWSDQSVTGTMTYTDQVVFTRKLTLNQRNIWDLTDGFVATDNDQHALEWFFHFAPGLDFQLEAQSMTILKNGKSLLVLSLPANVSVLLRDAWFSYDYGMKQTTKELYATWTGKLEKRETLFNWQFHPTGKKSMMEGD